MWEPAPECFALAFSPSLSPEQHVEIFSFFRDSFQLPQNHWKTSSRKASLTFECGILKKSTWSTSSCERIEKSINFCRGLRLVSCMTWKHLGAPVIFVAKRYVFRATANRGSRVLPPKSDNYSSKSPNGSKAAEIGHELMQRSLSISYYRFENLQAGKKELQVSRPTAISIHAVSHDLHMPIQFGLEANSRWKLIRDNRLFKPSALLGMMGSMKIITVTQTVIIISNRWVKVSDVFLWRSIFHLLFFLI